MEKCSAYRHLSSSLELNRADLTLSSRLTSIMFGKKRKTIEKLWDLMLFGFIRLLTLK